VLRGLAIGVLLGVRQVRLGVLGEEVDEDRQLPGNVDDDGPVAASPPLTRARDALLDQELADLSRDLTRSARATASRRSSSVTRSLRARRENSFSLKSCIRTARCPQAMVHHRGNLFRHRSI
jgi:hypothetical protein